jgi:hypothetical protein
MMEHWLKAQVRTFCSDGTGKLVDQWTKSTENMGENVEKTRYDSYIIIQSKRMHIFSLYVPRDFDLLHRQPLTYNIIHSFINSSKALCWALAAFQIHNPVHSR